MRFFSSIKVKKEYPPNIETIRKFFNPPKGTYFTFGDTLYNPDNSPIDKPLEEHEKMHMKQQKEYGKEKWWARYCVDAAFRLSQELPCYQVQYREGKKLIKDKNQLMRWKVMLAKSLSSELYGNIITFQQAVNAIEETKLFVFKI